MKPLGLFKVPSWCWWVLGGAAFLTRLLFILKGNIAFNSDEASLCLGIANYCQGGFGLTQPQVDVSGLRLWLGALVYGLSGGWVHFVSLTTLLLMTLATALLVRWVHERISPAFALVLLVLLAFPSASSAYFSTHLERRVETFLWAFLMLHFSGTWSASRPRLLLFGALLGWAFCGEPFILFFVLPVAIQEGWLHLDPRKVPWAVWGTLALGLGGGILLGHYLNYPFYQLVGTVRWSWAGPGEILRNWGLLLGPFPQYWSGNFPFGYLQASPLGTGSFPMREGGFTVFLRVWLGFWTVIGLWGIVQTWASDRKARLLVLSTCGPAFLYLGFFIFSGQTWDATSFRYISFLSFGFPLMWTWGIVQVLRRQRFLGMALLLFYVTTQTWLLADFLARAPQRHPVLKIVEGFERAGLTRGWANHWAAESATWFSRGELGIGNYDHLLWGFVRPQDLAGTRLGLVFLEGVDRPDLVSDVIGKLGQAGFRPHREWPMKEGWTLLEFQRVPLKGPSPTTR